MTSEEDGNLVFPRLKRNFVVGLIVSAALCCAAIGLGCVEKNRQLLAVEIIGACLCAFYAAYCIWEIRDSRPGLVVDREGIVDNMGSTPMGRIPWTDITGFRISDVYDSRYVLVDVVDPQKYIERHGWPQSVAQVATELAGSPLGFTGESIGMTPDELFRVLRAAREQYDLCMR
jgi:hypothetical protein